MTPRRTPSSRSVLSIDCHSVRYAEPWVPWLAPWAGGDILSSWGSLQNPGGPPKIPGTPQNPGPPPGSPGTPQIRDPPRTPGTPAGTPGGGYLIILPFGTKFSGGIFRDFRDFGGSGGSNICLCVFLDPIRGGPGGSRGSKIRAPGGGGNFGVPGGPGGVPGGKFPGFPGPPGGLLM